MTRTKDCGADGEKRAGTRARQALVIWTLSLARARTLTSHRFSSSFLRSSFLLFVHLFPLRSSFVLFVHHHFSSSFIIFPLRSSFLLFVHHVSSSFIIFPLRERAAGHVGRVFGKFSFCTSIKSDTAVSAYIFPLRSSFLLFVLHLFIIRPLRLSFVLFVQYISSSFITSLLFLHHFSSSFIISPLPAGGAVLVRPQ